MASRCQENENGIDFLVILPLAKSAYTTKTFGCSLFLIEGFICITPHPVTVVGSFC